MPVEGDFLVPAGRLSSTRVGAIITFVSEDGLEFRGRIVGLEKRTALVRVFEKLDFPSESALHLTLVQALPNREKMLFILQKGVELGVTAFIPCRSSRSAPSVAMARGQNKSHRWPATVQKAVEQCRRRVVPTVGPVDSLSEILRSFSSGDAVKLILYEQEPTTRLKDLVSTQGQPQAVVLVCGPEGGFTEGEVFLARESGFVPVRLGGRILRCETAAIAAVSIIQHVWGDL
jgi:16S rRNA (uracil1498-N3)-methyltransferase